MVCTLRLTFKFVIDVYAGNGKTTLCSSFHSCIGPRRYWYDNVVFEFVIHVYTPVLERQRLCLSSSFMVASFGETTLCSTLKYVCLPVLEKICSCL